MAILFYNFPFSFLLILYSQFSFFIQQRQERNTDSCNIDVFILSSSICLLVWMFGLLTTTLFDLNLTHSSRREEENIKSKGKVHVQILLVKIQDIL